MSNGPDAAPPGLVSSAEIARIAGVTRAAVSNWRKRYSDFPAPVVGGRNAQFDLQAVQAWLQSERPVSETPGETQIWAGLRLTHGNDVQAALADVAEFLLHGHIGRLGVRERQALQGMPGPEGLDAVLEQAGIGTSLGTTQSLVRAVGAVIAGLPRQNSAPPTVLDPACGIGNLLLDVVPEGTKLGQELNRDAARLCQARAQLMGLEVTVKVGDSLRADAWKTYLADIVVCEPPVGINDWGREDLLLDPRWEFGAPTKGEGELAWLQHCYAHLRPGGYAVIALPQSVANRKSGTRIRAEMIRRGALKQVAALPAGVATTHQQPLHLWVLSRDEEGGKTPDSIRMVDLSGPTADALAPSVEVPAIELLDEFVDLSPGRYLAAQQRPPEIEYTRVAQRMAELTAQFNETLAQFQPGEGKIAETDVRVSDLMRAGLVTVTRNEVSSKTEQIDDEFLRRFVQAHGGTVRGSGSFRTDARGARIPQLDKADQRRYAEAFAALDEVEATLRELSQLGRDTLAEARQALVNGWLKPSSEEA